MAHNLNGPLVAWTHKLATKSEIAEWNKTRITRRCDPRIQRLADLLKSLPKPDLVTFEDVLFSTYTLQCQLWSAFRTAVWLTFGQSAILDCIPVSTLKLFATGSGAADKTAMERSFRKRHPELLSCLKDKTDDTFDAAWIYLWTQHNLVRMPLRGTIPR